MGLFGKSQEEKDAIKQIEDEQRLENEQMIKDAEAEKKKMDEIVNKILLSTTPQLENYKVTEYKGTVQTLVMSELNDLDWSEILSSSTSANSLQNAFSEVQESVDMQLKILGVEKNANAIVGISYDTEIMETNTGREDILTSLPIIDKKIVLTGYGTAVVIEKI